MKEDWIVTISYKNKNLETVVEKEYTFDQYTEMCSLGLKHILMDIEDVFYYFQDNKQKSEWDQEAMNRFNVIRHKMLDQANAIQRLPQTLTYKGNSPTELSINEYITERQKNGLPI
jgi:hypothetical protein